MNALLKMYAGHSKLYINDVFVCNLDIPLDEPETECEFPYNGKNYTLKFFCWVFDFDKVIYEWRATIIEHDSESEGVVYGANYHVTIDWSEYESTT